MNVANFAEGVAVGLVVGGGLVLYFRSSVSTILAGIENRLKNIEAAVTGRKVL